MSGCVTVTGPPRAIWRRKSGITLPEAEHVAEAHRDVMGAVPVHLAGGRGLDDPLADGLGLPEHVRRIHGLVGRDEHEALRPVLGRHLGQHLRAQDVVAHRLERIRLHQGHVLVRGRVEDDGGPVALEELAHLGGVLHVRERGGRGGEVPLVLEARARLDERVLGVVDEHDPLGAERRRLPAELRADGAAGW